MGLEADDLGVLLRHRVGVEPLASPIALDVDVRAVGERRDAAPVLRLISDGEKLEADFKASPGVTTVRVEVDRLGGDFRTRPQESAGARVEDIRVPAHLVYRPGGNLTGSRNLGPPDHVVDDVPSTHCFPAELLIGSHVIDLADLHR